MVVEEVVKSSSHHSYQKTSKTMNLAADHKLIALSLYNLEPKNDPTQD